MRMTMINQLLDDIDAQTYGYCNGERSPLFTSKQMTSITATNATPERTPYEIAQTKYADAKNTTSIPGEICKFVGSLGALAGGLLVVVSVGTGNAGALVVSGGIAAVGALAGAPIAALGSIATQTKKNTKFAELDAYIARHRIGQ